MNKTEFSIVLSTEPPRTSPSVIQSHIPVPRISTAIKTQERCPPRFGGFFEKPPPSRGTVAAQKATFERLEGSEASVVQPRPSHRDNNQLMQASSIEARNTVERLWPVGAHKINDIVKFSRSNSFTENKWRSKHDESEKKRKFLLQKNEAGNYLSRSVAQCDAR